MILDELTFGGDFRIAQLRYVTEDGGYFRRSLSPGDDLSDLPDVVRAKIEAEWTPEVVAAYIAETTKAEPEDGKRLVPKSVIVSRLIAAGKIGAAKAALDASPAAFARWFASDRPAINHDDPDALALLTAIGADPETILAP